PLVIQEADCDVGTTRLDGYPGGARPTSTVSLHGDCRRGRGENVAWTDAAHERFDVRAVPLGTWRLGEWAAAVHAALSDPYERAALEAAAIDLALRQRDTNLFRLVDADAGPVRYVVSFDKVPDPVARATIEAPGVELKIDVDPRWTDATWAALAATGRV